MVLNGKATYARIIIKNFLNKNISINAFFVYNICYI